jgi:beta-glucanase (GH16 family)
MKVSNLLLNLKYIFFILNLFHTFSISLAIVQRTYNVNLASMHIENAMFQLKESIRFSKELNNVCGKFLFLAQNGLKSSQMRIVDNPNYVYDKLIQVQNIIETCMNNINENQGLRLSILLRKIEQNLINAKKIINENTIHTSLKDSLQEGFGNESNIPLFYNKSFATTLDHSIHDIVFSNNLINDHNTNEFVKFHQHLNSISQFFPIPPMLNIMMDEMVVDYCSNHINLEGYNATIGLDRGCGGKFHSRSKYSSGVFTIQMRAPLNASGVSSSFYISSNDVEPDIISFDVIGNLPNRVLTTYVVNGSHIGALETFHMDFDTSLEFHEYTIKWDASSIIWMIDKMVLRTLRSHRVHMYPMKPGHIFGYICDASYVAGKIDWKNGPFFVHYNDLQIISPLSPKQWRPPPQRQYRNVPILLQPLLIEYCASNVAVNNHLKNFAITFDQFGCGSRIRSLNSYTSGIFKAYIKCPIGDTSGLLTSMYLSSSEGTNNQDEIDFEFLGNNKQIVQTNFYVNGSGGHELWVNLDFDCSHDYHTYAIHYNKYKIQWFVDSKLVRKVFRNDQLQNQMPYPMKRMFLYVSVWNASSVEDGMWTGKWHGRDMPYTAQYSNVTIQFP